MIFRELRRVDYQSNTEKCLLTLICASFYALTYIAFMRLRMVVTKPCDDPAGYHYL